MQSARILFDAYVSLIFSFTIMANDQGATLVQFFEELPIIVEQVTSNIHNSSNINLLEYFYRKHDSLNVVNIFLCSVKSS